MDINLSANEARLIGCLMEKEITTPDQYPLSLNALTSACNQKSNRDPVMALTEAEVLDTLTELGNKRLIREETGFGSRVVKYKHRFCNTEFSELQLSGKEYALVCVLLLRGPQTPGELRTRTNRLCDFSDVAEVERILTGMAQRENGALVMKLEREPGKRESRYAQLFCDDMPLAVAAAAEPVSEADAGRIEELENQLSQLQQQVELLEERIRLLEG